MSTQNLAHTAQLPIRVLYVDDEPSLRLTWPEILRQRGYRVSVAATVAEATGLIATRKYDVLLSDLNITYNGDGLALAATFKAANPDACVLIITGYPDIDGALQAIKAHPDDYLIKPMEVEDVLSAIHNARERRKENRRLKRLRLVEILRAEIVDIQEEWLAEVKQWPELMAIPLSDEERVDHLPGFLREMCLAVEFHPETTSAAQLEAAWEHGRIRRKHGYRISNIVEEMRLLKRAIFLILQRNLLEIDFSRLLTDQLQMIESLDLQLKASLEAWAENERAAA